MFSTIDKPPTPHENSHPDGSDTEAAKGIAAGCGLGVAIWASLILLCMR